MGIEKKAALVCVVILAILFGIGLSNREQRSTVDDGASDRSREIARKFRDAKLASKDRPEPKSDVIDEDQVEPVDVPEEEPEFRFVKVKNRDNFSRIAKRELGDANLYPILVRANPELQPRNLQLGQQVKIPLAPKNGMRLVKPEVRGERPAKPQQHRVLRNETLSGIARAHYGRASDWKKIFVANRNQLRRPESLREGMVIRMP